MKSSCRLWLAGITTLWLALTSAWAAPSPLLLEAQVTKSPAPQITLSWDIQPSVITITIYRRILGAEGDAAWGTAVATITSPESSYVDTDVAVGTIYEYKLKPNYNYTYQRTTHFLVAGIEAPLVESRGKMLLVVDDTVAAPLELELKRLERDLAGDGWTVVRHDSPRHLAGTAEALKAWVVSKYNEDPANTKSVFLFGRLPIVMSGNLAPDGHNIRPHATDLFYADVNDPWTDVTTNNPTWGANIPNDGIYDQSYVPQNHTELEVGRVDLAGMTLWSQSEVELLRNYLRKDHLWRHGEVEDTRNGIQTQTLDYDYMEYAGLHSLYPSSKVVKLPYSWSPEAETNPYTWGVSFGDSSPYGYLNHNYKMTFVLNFGSYKQEWQNENNTMRAMLTMPDYGLACMWGSRPFLFFHHMGMGGTIGYSAHRTQNNTEMVSDYYPSGSSYGGIHVNLMGDPTLRMYAVAPPTQAVAHTNALGGITVTWSASADDVLGYHAYRSTDIRGPFARLNDTLLTTTSFTDSAAPAGTNFYMVRAVRLEQAATGTYYNPSQGAFASYPPQFATLRVVAAPGVATTPAAGDLEHPINESLICRASPTLIGTTTQVVPTGWTGTGDVPTTGEGDATPPFVLTRDSSITWLLATNVWLEVGADPQGSVDMASGWFPLGTNVSLRATATAFSYVFSHWSGDGVPPGMESVNPLPITLSAATGLTAHFVLADNPDNVLPFAEAFEQYPDSQSLPGVGGWSLTESGSATMTTDPAIIGRIADYGALNAYPINTTHEKAVAINGPAEVRIAKETNKVVVVSVLAQLAPFDGAPLPDLSTNRTHLAVLLSGDGHPVLFHANPLSGELGWTTFTNMTFAGSDFHTISTELDYRTTGVGDYYYARMRFDEGAWIAHANGYSVNDPTGVPGGTWFALRKGGTDGLSGLEFRGYSVIDDILIAEDWKQGNGDTDGDGMWDRWELQYFGGTNQPGGSAQDDWDGDGADNVSEYRADTIPADTNSHLSVTGIAMEGDGIRISWQGGRESRQYLDRADALGGAGAIWQTIRTNMPPTTTVQETLDLGEKGHRQFYRVRAERLP